MNKIFTPWWEHFFAGRNRLLWSELLDRSDPDGWSDMVLPWIEHVQSDDPDLPLVLPYIDRNDGQLYWYAGARSKLGALRLREELLAFVGSSYSDFDGRPHEFDLTDPVDAAFSEFCVAPVFRFSAVHPSFVEKIQRTLTLYVGLLMRRRRIKVDVPRPFGTLRSGFERALLAGDEGEAFTLFEEMRRVGRLGVENRLFLEVRLLAGLGRWRQIAEDKEMLRRLSDLLLPPRVLADVIEALYLNYIENEEDATQPKLALDAFRNAGINQFGHLFSTRRGLTLPRVIKAFGLFELCRDMPDRYRLEKLAGQVEEGPNRVFVESLLQLLPESLEETAATHDPMLEAEQAFNDLDYERALDGYILSPPNLQRLSRILVCARQIGTQETARQALTVLETEHEQDLGQLSKRLQDELKKLRHQASPLGGDVTEKTDWESESHQGWLAWVRWVNAGAPVETAVTIVRNNFLTWDTAELLNNLDRMEEMANVIGNAVGQAANVFRETYPEIYQAFVPEKGTSARNAKPLLSILLDNTVLLDGPSLDELELARQLSVALLTLGLSQKDYNDLVDSLRELSKDQTSLSTLNWALDVAEVLLLYPCPAPETRLMFVSDLLGVVKMMSHRLSAVHRVVVGEICKDLGIDDCPIGTADSEVATVENEIANKLVGLRIAIYTLTEPAGKRAESTLKTICPTVTVQLNSDKECTKALKVLAKSVDLFVFAWKSSKHQAYYCVKDNRPSGWPILLPLGKGSSSILREIFDAI